MRALSFVTAVVIIMGGCATPMKDLTHKQPPQSGIETMASDELQNLPELSQKITVAVYEFDDQTGQYKQSETVTSFSTAVSQGATSILMEVLQQAGCFKVVERENYAQLQNERTVIRNMEMQQGKAKSILPPLRPANILIGGGIVSYDTNTLSGGLGAKYYGIGGFGDARTDEMTISLRATDVMTGEMMIAVTTSKKILSQRVDFGVYRFISLQRLLEIEMGYAKNEPRNVCLRSALERAVVDLVVKGILEGCWSLKNPDELGTNPVIKRYRQELAQQQISQSGTANPRQQSLEEKPTPRYAHQGNSLRRKW